MITTANDSSAELRSNLATIAILTNLEDMPGGRASCSRRSNSLFIKSYRITPLRVHESYVHVLDRTQNAVRKTHNTTPQLFNQVSQPALPVRAGSTKVASVSALSRCQSAPTRLSLIPSASKKSSNPYPTLDPGHQRTHGGNPSGQKVKATARDFYGRSLRRPIATAGKEELHICSSADHLLLHALLKG